MHLLANRLASFRDLDCLQNKKGEAPQCNRTEKAKQVLHVSEFGHKKIN